MFIVTEYAALRMQYLKYYCKTAGIRHMSAMGIPTYFQE